MVRLVASGASVTMTDDAAPIKFRAWCTISRYTSCGVSPAHGRPGDVGHRLKVVRGPSIPLTSGRSREWK